MELGGMWGAKKSSARGFGDKSWVNRTRPQVPARGTPTEDRTWPLWGDGVQETCRNASSWVRQKLSLQGEEWRALAEPAEIGKPYQSPYLCLISLIPWSVYSLWWTPEMLYILLTKEAMSLSVSCSNEQNSVPLWITCFNLPCCIQQRSELQIITKNIAIAKIMSVNLPATKTAAFLNARYSLGPE